MWVLSWKLTILFLKPRKVSGRASRSESCDRGSASDYGTHNSVRNDRRLPPGRAKITARFPLNRSAVLTSFHLKGLGPGRESSRTLALNTTFGTVSPSFRCMDKDLPSMEDLALTTGLNAKEDTTSENSNKICNILRLASLIRRQQCKRSEEKSRLSGWHMRCTRRIRSTLSKLTSNTHI